MILAYQRLRSCARISLQDVVTTFREHLLSFVPDWKNVYGAFRPFYFAGIQTFYHQL